VRRTSRKKLIGLPTGGCFTRSFFFFFQLKCALQKIKQCQCLQRFGYVWDKFDTNHLSGNQDQIGSIATYKNYSKKFWRISTNCSSLSHPIVPRFEFLYTHLYPLSNGV
jgi:hypothetical protein